MDPPETHHDNIIINGTITEIATDNGSLNSHERPVCSTFLRQSTVLLLRSFRVPHPTTSGLTKLWVLRRRALRVTESLR